MATVSTVIQSARYDLSDFQTGIQWDNTELLNYLNRIYKVLHSELATLDSDLVEGEETDIDTVSDQNYVDLSSLNSGNWSHIKAVWRGTNLLEQTSLFKMRYKRIYRGSTVTGPPYYWAVKNQNLLFEQKCDQAYTDLVIYYYTKPADLALTDSMPYNDRFNDTFIEMLNFYARAKEDRNVGQAMTLTREILRKRAMEETIQRGFVQKPYYIDF